MTKQKGECFWLASVSDKLAEASYFDDSKSLIQVQSMEKVLDTLNFQMRKKKKNVILFLDYAPECNFKECNFTFAAASYWFLIIQSF